MKEIGESRKGRRRVVNAKTFNSSSFSFCKLALQAVGRCWDEAERARDITLYSIYSDHVPHKLSQHFSQKCLFYLTPSM